MVSRQQQPIVVAIVIATTALILLSFRLSSDLYSPVLFIIKALFFPISILFLLLSSICLLYFRQMLTSIAFIFSLLILLPFLLPDNGNKTKQKLEINSFKIATFSTLTRTKNYQDVTRFIKDYRPDILCLQEVSAKHLPLLKAEIKSTHQHTHTNKGNLTIFSRYPIVLNEDQGAFFSATVTVPTIGETTLINSHMPRQYRKKALHENWKSLLNLLSSVKDQPTILCGDLNLTPHNTLYDTIIHNYGYLDAHQSGYGFTFPNAQRKISVLGLSLIHI